MTMIILILAGSAVFAAFILGIGVVIFIASKSSRSQKKQDYYSQSRTVKENLGSKLRMLFQGKIIDENAIEEIEEMLIKADIGPRPANDLIEIIREKSPKDINEAINLIKTSMKESLLHKRFGIKKGELNILLIIGVNGVGKTTSIAKIANLYKNQGFKVLLAAGDTFRAAAVEQLAKWANTLDIPIIKQHENADPSSVVFDAVDSAIAKGVDLLLVDTAGRLHNKANLTEELKKIERTISKKGSFNRENILVIDATTGQNAFHQAESFNQSVGINGIVLTKYDSKSKGGIVINIQKNLGIPFYFLGTGEKLENIEEFNNENYIENIFS